MFKQNIYHYYYYNYYYYYYWPVEKRTSFAFFF